MKPITEPMSVAPPTPSAVNNTSFNNPDLPNFINNIITSYTEFEKTKSRCKASTFFTAPFSKDRAYHNKHKPQSVFRRRA